MPEIIGLMMAVKAKKAASDAAKVIAAADTLPREVHYVKNAISATRRLARFRAEDYVDQWLSEVVDTHDSKDLPEPIGDLALALLLEARDSTIASMQAYFTGALSTAWKRKYGTRMSIPWVFAAVERSSSGSSYRIVFSRIASHII